MFVQVSALRTVYSIFPAPGCLYSFLHGPLWRKKKINFQLYCIPWQINIYSTIPAKWGQVKMLPFPCIWLITASELRMLLCLVPLPRKTMPVKWSLVIQASKCPCKGCILVLIMHYGNIIDSYLSPPKHKDLLEYRLIWPKVELGQGKVLGSIFCAAVSSFFPSLRATEEWCFKNVIAKAISSFADKLQKDKSAPRLLAILQSAAKASPPAPPPPPPKKKSCCQCIAIMTQRASGVSKIKGATCQNPLWLLQTHLGSIN